MNNTYRSLAAFVVGVAATIFVVGFISDAAQGSKVDDCQKLGKFRYKGKVFECRELSVEK